MKDKINKIFNSYKIIIIALILFIIFLLIYNKNITSTYKTYIFSGSSDYVDINSLFIILNYNINLFQVSNIEYK